MALGFGLAFHKIQDSSENDRITWTSAVFNIDLDREAITVQVKDDIVAEVKDTVENMMKQGAIDISALQTLAGQSNCIAGLLYTWRPFVSMLYGPIYDTRSRCPFNGQKVWRCALDVPLTWMSAFLKGVRGTLSRTYFLSDFLGEGDQISVTRRIAIETWRLVDYSWSHQGGLF